MSDAPLVSRKGNRYRPNPPARFVGPPSWLAERPSDHVADADKMIPPPRTFVPASRNPLIMGCDYRGEDAEPCGCAKLHYCLAGKGRKAEGMGVGTVTLRDCLDCVTGL